MYAVGPPFNLELVRDMVYTSLRNAGFIVEKSGTTGLIITGRVVTLNGQPVTMPLLSNGVSFSSPGLQNNQLPTVSGTGVQLQPGS